MSGLILFWKKKKVDSIFEKNGDMTFDEFFGYFNYKYPKDYLKILEWFYDKNGGIISRRFFPVFAHNPDEYLENMYRAGKRRYHIRHPKFKKKR